jgi:hypothetical protein
VQEELQYALVTSSALPSEIQESEHYIGLDKEQWLDLVDYSTEVVKADEKQEILFLIVAKGTTEQQAEDDLRRQSKIQEKTDLAEENADLKAKHNLLQSQLNEILTSKEKLASKLSSLEDLERLEMEEQTQAFQAESQRKSKLRSKSISLFNALYER